MALAPPDHFSSTFLDFRLPPPTTNSIFNLFVFFPSNRSSASRIIAFRRRSLHLTFLSKPSSSNSNLDVVSTHEHSDGSLLFRFGDPSQVEKTAKPKESITVKDKAETLGKENEGFAGVKVLDKYSEADTAVKTEDGGVTTSLNSIQTDTDTVDAVDESNSITISSETFDVIEQENGLNDSSLKGSADIEFLDQEMEPVSSGFGEEENDLNDSSPEGLTEIELLDQEMEAVPSGFAEEENGLNDSSSEGSTDVEWLEEYTETVSSGLSVQDTANLERSVDEDQTDGLATSPSLVPGLVMGVSDAQVLKASLETVVYTDECAGNEHDSVKTEVQNDILPEDNRTVESELVSLHPSSELAENPSQVIKDQNSQSGMQHPINGEASGSDMNDLRQDVIVVNENGVDINGTDAKLVSNSIIAEGQASEVGTGVPNKIVEDVNESDEIQLPIVSPQMEAEPMLEEPVTDTMEKSTEDNGAESLTSKGDLIQPSAYEVTRMESTESATWSKEISLTDLALSSGAALLPHPSKVLTGGEDAYFIAGQTWLGVADGVGHWSLEGTSPGCYAKELIKTCERLVSDCNGDSVNNLVELLNLSVAETHAPGSSTILIAHFDGQALHVANIGDSGFIILRHGTVYKKSSSMSHGFHFPLQVETGDEPSCLAELYRVELEEGDVIIIATDGLLDNLYNQEISSIVTKSLGAGKDLEEIAELLATKAQVIGGYAYGRSPFADDAQAAGYSGCTGGKLDDVAVILSVVRSRQ